MLKIELLQIFSRISIVVFLTLGTFPPKRVTNTVHGIMNGKSNNDLNKTHGVMNGKGTAEQLESHLIILVEYIICLLNTL